MRGAENNEWESAGPEGVGGWLVLLILGVWISAGLRGFAGFEATLPALGLRHAAEGPMHAGLLTGLIELFAALFAAITAFLLMRRNLKAPELARVFLFVNVLYYGGSLLWTLKTSAPYVADAIPMWAEPAFLLAASLAGFAYAVRSRRIATTYAPQDEQATEGRWEEMSILPRLRPRSPEANEEAEPAMGLAEQLSMRREPITADAEARLMIDLKARIAEHVGTHRVKRVEAGSVQDPTEAQLASEPPPHVAHPSTYQEPVAASAHMATEPGASEPLTSAQVAEPSETMLSAVPQANEDSEEDLEMEPPQVADEVSSESPQTNELALLKTRIREGLARWIGEAENSSQKSGSTADDDKARARFLKQVDEICEHAWAVHLGRFATLPNTPDAGGSLSKELQKWAIAQAAFRLTRSLDIRAAMEARGPFEQVAEDRDYLLAIVHRNACDDRPGRTVAIAADYEGQSGPEIAYKLIVSAQRDLSEARMWAEVVSLAGDADFLRRFEDAGSKAFQESRQYWRGWLTDAGEDPDWLQAAGVASGPRPGRRIPL